MTDALFWTKVSAIGDVAGAAATFLAVIVSLYFAYSSRRPRLKLVVGERLIVGGPETMRLLMFSLANTGERPVHVRSIGWRTGWLVRGPSWLKLQAAVQLTGIGVFGTSPPYELQPGSEVSSYAEMENILSYSRERKKEPLFSRDYPIFGRRRTRVRAFAYTAEGYRVRAKPEQALVKKLFSAECDALIEQRSDAPASPNPDQ